MRSAIKEETKKKETMMIEKRKRKRDFQKIRKRYWYLRSYSPTRKKKKILKEWISLKIPFRMNSLYTFPISDFSLFGFSRWMKLNLRFWALFYYLGDFTFWVCISNATRFTSAEEKNGNRVEIFSGEHFETWESQISRSNFLSCGVRIFKNFCGSRLKIFELHILCRNHV